MQRIWAGLLCCLVLAACGRTPSTGWQDVDGRRVYLDETGTPLTGWQELGGRTYCFRPDGTPLTGWVPGEEGSRYFALDGAMLTGQQQVDGVTCFFAPNGVQVLLVNPQHTLPPDYAVKLQDIGGGRQIAARCYEDLQAMLADCKAAGGSPAVCSAYRSPQRQQELFDRKVRYYLRQGHDDATAAQLAGTVVARPGTSEHELGLALDIVDTHHWNLDDSQADTPTQQWLMAHSWEYGFLLRYPAEKTTVTGVIYEPWHYRYLGRPLAKDVQESGLCLEEFLGAKAPR